MTELDDIARDLFSDLCEGEGQHSESLDRALIMKHLRRVERAALATQQAAIRDLQKHYAAWHQNTCACDTCAQCRKFADELAQLLGEPGDKQMSDEIPRRCRLDLNTPAERAIYEAMVEVEKLPPDVRLTDAVILLGEARNAVADFVDDAERTKRRFIRVEGDVPARAAHATQQAKGGRTRAKKLTPEQRQTIARKAAQARWGGRGTPEAK